MIVMLTVIIKSYLFSPFRYTDAWLMILRSKDGIKLTIKMLSTALLRVTVTSMTENFLQSEQPGMSRLLWRMNQSFIIYCAILTLGVYVICPGFIWSAVLFKKNLRKG